ncbi:MAG: ABC transporter permease subunit [Oscillospiraceae bacterium]|nr:ABC transporter permease subunit [Oscillospiraceae bacterium]
MKKIFSGIVSAAFWLLLWEIIHLIVDQSILVPSPLSVFERLLEFCLEKEFWLAVGSSLFRVISGLFIGTILGAVLAAITAENSFLRTLFAPALHIIKSTPVASFIILAILWLSIEKVPVFTSLLMVLPSIWANTEKGILSVDRDLLQMGKAFGLSKKEIFLRITIPAVKPFFTAALKSAVGMAWKAGIAAEVICQNGISIGSALHDSKIYFETVDTFAWTAAIVILSVLLEKFILTVTVKGEKRHA